MMHFLIALSLAVVPGPTAAVAPTTTVAAEPKDAAVPDSKESSPTGPTAIIKEADGKMRALARSAQASTVALANLADSFIDFAELSRRSLDDEWKRLSPKKRTEFVKAMSSMLRTSYASKALVEGKKESVIQYDGEDIRGNEATVRSTIRVGNQKIPVHYKLFQSESGAWKIYDVVTDDTSLLETYRGDFRQIIARKGFDGLLQAIKAKQRQQIERSAKG